MRKFNITVNGKSYEVDVEEIGGVSAPVRPVAQPAVQPAPAKPVAAAQPKPAPQAASQAPTAPSAPVSEGSTTVVAPMPGTIIDIKKNVGDTVNRGDLILILEAMKMENDIMAPAGGRIVAINTSKGASVNSGDILVVIE